MRKACGQYGISIPPDNISNNRHRIQNNNSSSSSGGDNSRSNCYGNFEEEGGIYVQDPEASWACMRRAVFGYAANSAKQCQDNAVAIRFISALLRLMLRIEDNNVKLYSAWIPLLEQYVAQEAQRQQQQQQQQQQQSGSASSGSMNYSSNYEDGFKPLGAHRVLSFSGVDNVPTNGPQDLDESRHGHVYSAAPSLSSTDPSVASSSLLLPSQGSKRAGRFSIASLREFDAQAGIAGGGGGRLQSMGGGYNTMSTMSSMSNQSILQPIGSMNSAAIFNHQYTANPINYMPNGASVSTGAAGGNFHDNNFAKRILEVDPTAGLRDMVHDSAEAFRSGLRKISAPSLPPKLMSMMMMDGHHSDLFNGSNVIAGSKGNRPNSMRRHRSGSRKDEAESAISNGASSNYETRRMPFHSHNSGGSHRSVQLSPLEETLRALQMMLESSSVPMEHQDQALGLLEDIARHVDPCWPVDLPILAEFCRPCLLPVDGCRPLRLLPESKLAQQLVAQRREAAKKLQENGEALAISNNGVAGHAAPDPTIPKKSGALYYDPFAAQRAKDVKKRMVAEVIWAVHTVGSVKLVINNPLAIPLTLDSLSLVAEGVDHIAYERAAIVPPYHSDFEVVLTLKPLEVGTLTLTAVKVFVNNAMHFVKLASNGRCISKYGTEVSEPWTFPHAIASTTSGKSNGPTTAASGKGGAVSTKGASPGASSSPGDQLDTAIGIETTTIIVVSEGMQFKLLPRWPDSSYIVEDNTTTTTDSNLDTAVAVSRKELTSSKRIVLPLLKGEVRRETISLAENVVSENRIHGDVTISHCRISAVQTNKATAKAQTFILKNFGNGFADTCVEDHSTSPCCCKLVSYPDLDLGLASVSAFDIVLEFGHNHNISDVDSLRIEVELLTSQDTDFDAMVQSEVDDKSISICCRK
jgi:hypothetical protein